MENKCKDGIKVKAIYFCVDGPPKKGKKKKLKAENERLTDLNYGLHKKIHDLKTEVDLARLPVVDLPYGERAVFKLLDNRTNVEGNHVGVIDNIEMTRIPSNSVSCSDAFEMTIKIQIER